MDTITADGFSYTINPDTGLPIITILTIDGFKNMLDWGSSTYKKSLLDDKISTRDNVVVNAILNLCVPADRKFLTSSQLWRAILNYSGVYENHMHKHLFGTIMSNIIDNNLLPGFNIKRSRKYTESVYVGLAFIGNHTTDYVPTTNLSILPVPTASLTPTAFTPKIVPTIVTQVPNVELLPPIFDVHIPNFVSSIPGLTPVSHPKVTSSIIAPTVRVPSNMLNNVVIPHIQGMSGTSMTLNIVK